MTKQHWAMFVMGTWIAGSLIIFVVATQNFRTVDRLLAASSSATFSAQVGTMGRAEARDLLRYLSSELNRLYFRLWSVAQVPLGLLAVWLIGGRPAAAGARWGAAAMLGVAAVMAVWLTPAITSLGRSLDFVPRDPPPPGFGRFWVLHGAYTLLEGAKLVIGLGVAMWISRMDLQR